MFLVSATSISHIAFLKGYACFSSYAMMQRKYFLQVDYEKETLSVFYSG